MTVAVFTFTTESELAALRTEHPVRGVLDNDIALVCGGETEDDVLVFQAQIIGGQEAQGAASPSSSPSSSPSASTATPTYIEGVEFGVIGDGSSGSLKVKALILDLEQIYDFGVAITNLPYSLASDDGRVQWNMVSRGYSSGGIPKTSQIEMTPTGDVDQAWEDLTIQNPIDYNNMFFTHVGSRDGGGYYYQCLKQLDNILWLIEGEYIVSFDMQNDMKPTYYRIPEHTYSDISYTADWFGYCAMTYCEYDGLFHIVGGPSSSTDTYSNAHTTFNPLTGHFAFESLAPFPRKSYRGHLLDTSALNKKIYFFADDNNSTSQDELYIVYRYDVLDDYWDTVPGTYPLTAYDGPELSAHIEDPHMKGHYLLFSWNGEIIRFNPTITQYTPAPEFFEIVDNIPGGYISTTVPGTIMYDNYTSLIIIPYYDDIQIWDIVLNTLVWEYNYFDTERTWQFPDIWAPTEVDGGAGIQLDFENSTITWASSWDYYDFLPFFRLNQKANWKYIGHG